MLDTKPRILIVDDYPPLITLMKHRLMQKGYEVLTAQNGKDALHIARKDYPDLIISDIEMPEMDGYELCSIVKSDEDLKRIPFILVTSLVTSEHVMKGIEAGADNYLTKPSDDETLFTKVEDLLNNPPVFDEEYEEFEIEVEGKNYNITTGHKRLIDLLISTYKNTLAQNIRLEEIQQELNTANKELEHYKKEHETLIQNVFPPNVADSLLAYGYVSPERVDDATILFTDFHGFTKIVPELSPEQLIKSLSHYFDRFDEISSDHNITKIKTIGDSYMAVAGIEKKSTTHPIDAVAAAFKIKYFVESLQERLDDPSIPIFPVRIGIHTGPAVVGVIGKVRFAYDIWGTSVNLAARMEQNSEDGKINITQDTYDRIKDFFECEYRGEIEAKNIGKVAMYFAKRIKPELSEDDEGIFPNRLFIQKYNQLKKQAES